MEVFSANFDTVPFQAVTLKMKAYKVAAYQGKCLVGNEDPLRSKDFPLSFP